MEVKLFKLFIQNLEGATKAAFRHADTDELQARAEALESVTEVARGTLYQYLKQVDKEVESERKRYDETHGFNF